MVVQAEMGLCCRCGGPEMCSVLEKAGRCVPCIRQEAKELGL